MTNSLDNELARLLEESQRNQQREAETKEASDLAWKRRVEFLASYESVADSVIWPKLEALATRIESARRLGRWATTAAEATWELAADVYPRNNRQTVELRLSQGRWVFGLSFRADADRLRIEVSTGSAEIDPAYRTIQSPLPSRQSSEWLAPGDASDEAIDRYLEKFLASATKALRALGQPGSQSPKR